MRYNINQVFYCTVFFIFSSETLESIDILWESRHSSVIKCAIARIARPSLRILSYFENAVLKWEIDERREEMIAASIPGGRNTYINHFVDSMFAVSQCYWWSLYSTLKHTPNAIYTAAKLKIFFLRSLRDRKQLTFVTECAVELGNVLDSCTDPLTQPHCITLRLEALNVI